MVLSVERLAHRKACTRWLRWCVAVVRNARRILPADPALAWARLEYAARLIEQRKRMERA